MRTRRVLELPRQPPRRPGLNWAGIYQSMLLGTVIATAASELVLVHWTRLTSDRVEQLELQARVHADEHARVQAAMVEAVQLCTQSCQLRRR